MEFKFSDFSPALFMLSVLCFSSFNFTNPESDYKKAVYQIQPTSILEVNGKTNVNSFCCASSEQFEHQALDYKYDASKASISFLDTEFIIDIKKLDCGKKKINKDLFKALKVDEYPSIIIDLKDVLNLKCIDVDVCDEWVELEANTDITITCETKPFQIPILVKKMDVHSYKISGGAMLNLCDFDIKPPTAMMGLIKVKDAIEFNFELNVDVEL